jgi:hypothetical protein
VCDFPAINRTLGFLSCESVSLKKLAELNVAAVDYLDCYFTPIFFGPIDLDDFMIVDRYKNMTKFNAFERFGNPADEFVIDDFALRDTRLLRHGKSFLLYNAFSIILFSM